MPKCPTHGWAYAVRRDDRVFCCLCRDLGRQAPAIQREANTFLAQHPQIEAVPVDASIQTVPLFEDVLKAAQPRDEADLRVCIDGLLQGSVRAAASRYGMDSSLVFRVRLDFEQRGVEAATQRLLDYARRRLVRKMDSDPPGQKQAA